MEIHKLSFINHKTGWNVRDIEFNRTTLLVGASGVGKTQILNAIETISGISRGNSLNGIEWIVNFTHDDKSYIWSGIFETVDDDYQEFLVFAEEHKYLIKREKLICDGQVVIDRDEQDIVLAGKPTVKLDLHKSSVFLLKEEEIVKPVFSAFKRIISFNFMGTGINIFTDTDKISTMGIDEIKQSSILEPLHKLYFLKKKNLSEYIHILENFIEIFPLVVDIDFELGHIFSNRTSFPVLKIKEKKVASWIYQPNISSGMLRTLTQLIILELAVDGDVILKDEFENGLGINCIDKLADGILDSDKDIQVIMTSHHPYIINNIGYSDWKVVTRTGSDVHTYTAAELKIGERSKHDAFMQLINSKAYKTGE